MLKCQPPKKLDGRFFLVFFLIKPSFNPFAAVDDVIYLKADEGGRTLAVSKGRIRTPDGSNVIKADRYRQWMNPSVRLNGFHLSQKRKNGVQNVNFHTGVKRKKSLKNSLCSTTQTLLHSSVPRSVMYPESTQSWSVSPGHGSQKPPLSPSSKLHNSPSLQSAVVPHACSPLVKELVSKTKRAFLTILL